MDKWLSFCSDEEWERFIHLDVEEKEYLEVLRETCPNIYKWVMEMVSGADNQN